MHITELLRIRTYCQQHDIKPKELECIADIWLKCNAAMLARTANEAMTSVLFSYYIKANEDLCSEDEDTKRKAAYLLKARTIIAQEQVLELLTTPIPQIFTA